MLASADWLGDVLELLLAAILEANVPCYGGRTSIGRSKTNCALTELTTKAQADVMDIRNEISGGAPSESTKRRWDNIFRYTLNAGTFPVTPT
jgi:hypothetical protein